MVACVWQIKEKIGMAKQIEYNSILTEKEFTCSDRFRRAHKACVLCDASNKVLGSVSDKYVFDLFGEIVAERKSEDTQRDDSGNTIRVIEYASDHKTYRLAGDAFYAGEGSGRYLGRAVRKERNFFRIVVLSALCAMLIAAIVLIALVQMPVGQVDPPPVDIPPVIEISDTNGAWEDSQTLDVFGASVHPGSSGAYGFVLQNPHDLEILYAFSILPRYEGAASPAFPIRFRLRMNNVLLESEEWRTVEELRFDDLVLLPQTKQAFVLEWSWPFDAGADGNDTLIGADGGKISMVLRFSAQTK